MVVEVETGTGKGAKFVDIASGTASGKSFRLLVVGTPQLAAVAAGAGHLGQVVLKAGNVTYRLPTTTTSLTSAPTAFGFGLPKVAGTSVPAVHPLVSVAAAPVRVSVVQGGTWKSLAAATPSKATGKRATKAQLEAAATDGRAMARTVAATMTAVRATKALQHAAVLCYTGECKQVKPADAAYRAAWTAVQKAQGAMDGSAESLARALHPGPRLTSFWDDVLVGAGIVLGVLAIATGIYALVLPFVVAEEAVSAALATSALVGFASAALGLTSAMLDKNACVSGSSDAACIGFGLGMVSLVTGLAASGCTGAVALEWVSADSGIAYTGAALGGFAATVSVPGTIVDAMMAALGKDK
jgi:VIT1/CCC1 family predicted Fe2+/Mn2+ transporter